MPFFYHNKAEIYYEDTGQGEAIIAIHGLSENTVYWKQVAGIFASKYRFIAMDMRGHGRTKVEKEPYGFDADTIGTDIIALADHLNIMSLKITTARSH